MCALYTAAHAPRLVRAVFAIDPPLYAPEVELRDERAGFTAAAAQAGRPVAELTAAGVPAGRAESVSKLDPEVLPMLLDRTMFAGWDTDAFLSRIECPVVLEHGDRALGSAIYPGELERATALIKQCTVLHLEGSGHAPQFDGRERLLEALARFVGES
jgi:pimeloyl-ACP methyl ester carboxylesterase